MKSFPKFMILQASLIIVTTILYGLWDGSWVAYVFAFMAVMVTMSPIILHVMDISPFEKIRR